jgi:hypothetical protein
MKYIAVLFFNIGGETIHFEMDSKYYSYFQCAYHAIEYQTQLNQILEGTNVSNWATTWTCKVDQ